MENQSASGGDVDLTKISEFDPSFKPVFPAAWKNIDISRLILQNEEIHRKIREQMPRGPIYSMRSELKRLKTHLDLEPMSTWSPTELAAAGFYCTGLSNSSQCFSCGLVLCKHSTSFSPMENHHKFSPNCAFIQGKDAGNISKYDLRLQPSNVISTNEHVTMESEEKRLETYTNWPAYSLIAPAVLAQAGFFFTGTRDNVQCFSCAGCLGNWLENDDPWKEHAKWFSRCEFLRSIKSQREINLYIQSYSGFAGVTGTSFINNEKFQQTGVTKKMLPHLEDVKALNHHLVKLYSDQVFQKAYPFGDSVEMHIDLNSQFADISVVLKDTKNLPIEQLTLPDILSRFSDITMIEGEAGSGKTALLRKIAILWASGTCPILSRFALVFYISASSIENKQTLSDIICKQLLGCNNYLTEESFEEIIKHLGNQILFLVDDYGVMGPVAEAIEELMLKNHANRASVAVTVLTGKSRKLRKYARAVLSIQEFPLYSSLYLIKNLFPRDVERLKEFFMTLELNKGLQATLQTPLIILAQCSYWVQHPGARGISDTHAFKAYLMYHIKKCPSHSEKVKDLVKLCGDLALDGIFQARFNFTEDDLGQFDLDIDEVVNFGLLSKITAQRFRPLYRFFHPSFQEFLGGKRLGELLESEEQDELDTGFQYLKRVNTFLKIVGCYHYLVKYAIGYSAKAATKILSHLFSLYSSQEALDCHVESRKHLQIHPELELPEQILINTLNKILYINYDSYIIDLLLTFAVEAGSESQFLADCAPTITEFLTGKTMSFTLSPTSGALGFFISSGESFFLFIEKHPESISLLRCIQCNIFPNSPRTVQDFSEMSSIPKTFGIPTVEREYSSAFRLLNDVVQENQQKINETKDVFDLFPQEITISDSMVQAFTSLKGHKVPLLQIEATDVNIKNFAQSNCEKLKVLFSISDHIHLKLNNCSTFFQNNWPAIEDNLESFSGCYINNTDLNEEEQTQLFKMTALESLHIKGSLEAQPPDILISGVHNFTHLTELVIHFPKFPNVVELIPDQFGQLEKMKILHFTKVSSKFAEFLKNFRNLETLFLSLKPFTGFEGLMASLATYKKLKELHLPGPCLQDTEIAFLAEAIKNLKSLVALNLKNQIITARDVSEKIAVALGSLVHLKYLALPKGKGMEHAANLFIQQLQNLPNLKYLYIEEILDSESIIQLGKAAKSGYLRRIYQLDLPANDNIEEFGWKIFFETACEMPELTHLFISRLYTNQIKCHASTVTSFVRFVSKMPSLKKIVMHGWLLDKDDINMFNAMKENHPQSKSLNIYWQWVLPVAPKIEN
ncbi:baculoviral IAP repeat-containing protein 1-like [Spea bombifrons]|uniref:baculoviral IAP repeat-containing protein 1-like n=1 Tax=Spea bombifrons TaxID=233779 RepID=UPI00234A32B5|nr:baculoviral IAP repeat-containing protein 1-like [Spea bombifrons]